VAAGADSPYRLLAGDLVEREMGGGLPTLTREQVRVPLPFHSSPLYSAITSALCPSSAPLSSPRNSTCLPHASDHACTQSIFIGYREPAYHHPYHGPIHQPPHANKSVTDTPICMSRHASLHGSSRSRPGSTCKSCVHVCPYTRHMTTYSYRYMHPHPHPPLQIVSRPVGQPVNHPNPAKRQ
jgi:hypothetical protein